jgi:hypothetical protein
VKGAQPDKSDARQAGQVEARSEILKLGAQLKPTEEERDVLKNAMARQGAIILRIGGL